MRKLLLLAPVLLLASCHSAQVALQPKSAAVEPIVTATRALPFDSTQAATVVATRPATVVSAPTLLPAAQPLAPVQRPQRTSMLRPIARLATAGIAAPVAKRLAHRLQRQRPTEGTAESGLGGVALFFIGVVLAVLAGLAALVNLIFSVGFFTALGYTAAGLVVLFLLYSLFSKGKKKK
jgi:hypothetical protein